MKSILFRCDKTGRYVGAEETNKAILIGRGFSNKTLREDILEDIFKNGKERLETNLESFEAAYRHLRKI